MNQHTVRKNGTDKFESLPFANPGQVTAQAQALVFSSENGVWFHPPWTGLEGGPGGAELTSVPLLLCLQALACVQLRTEQGTLVITRSECSKHSALPGLDVREAVFPRINRNHGNRDVSRGPAAHPAADGQEGGLSLRPTRGGVTPRDLLDPSLFLR